jgi:coenzyme F420-reducing hydrogenase alpha subunit
MPSESGVLVHPCAGVGEAITEAPRGILYHRYETDADGLIRSATIIPPTSQNQPQIENDLFRVAPAILEMPEADAALHAERVVRNYDPCISCATHFVKLKVERQ